MVLDNQWCPLIHNILNFMIYIIPNDIVCSNWQPLITLCLTFIYVQLLDFIMYFNAIYKGMGVLIQLQQHIKIMDYIDIKHV
jgi:hypothetical protein